MTKLQNFGSQTPPKSDVQNFCPLKLVFLGLKFGQNHVFRQFWLYLPPPMVYMVGKPRISASIWHQAIKIWSILQAIRISGTHPDRLLNSSWHCVVSINGDMKHTKESKSLIHTSRKHPWIISWCLGYCSLELFFGLNWKYGFTRVGDVYVSKCALSARNMCQIYLQL